MSKYLIYRASLLLAVLLLPAITYCDVVILTPASESARDIAKQIQSEIERPSMVVQKLAGGERVDLVVAIGDNAFKEAIDSQNTSVLGTFLSAQVAPLKTSKQKSYLIFSEPSPQVIASFLKSNFSNKAIGYIYTRTELARINLLRKELNNSNVKLIAIESSGNTNSDIRSLIRERIDIVLISRNRNIYKPNTIRFTLEQLYRKKIPVVTTVPALVKFGALVSISPNSDVLVSSTAAQANAISRGSAPKETDLFIDEVDILVNDSMSELFEIHINGNVK